MITSCEEEPFNIISPLLFFGIEVFSKSNPVHYTILARILCKEGLNVVRRAQFKCKGSRRIGVYTPLP